MTKGTISYWNSQKGWGLVQLLPEDGGEELFLHYSDFTVPKNPEQGADFTSKNVEIGWIDSGDGKRRRAKSASVVEYFHLHEEMAGKGTEWRFCPVCGGYTPWTKDVTFKTGGMTYVSYDKDGDVEVGRPVSTRKGTCVPCQKRLQSEADALQKAKDEAELAEANRFIGMQYVSILPLFGDPEIFPVEIAKAYIPKYGYDKSVEVEVKFIGKNPYKRDAVKWSMIKKDLCHEDGLKLF